MDIKEELEKYIEFHEDKANYYHDWLEEVKAEESVIGFRYIKTEEDNYGVNKGSV